MRWFIAVVVALGAAVPLALLVYPVVGSGFQCEGIGFGCTPERLSDTALVVVVYAVGVIVTAAIVRRHRRWLAAGAALTLLATGVAIWSQLPRHPRSPGPLAAALDRWERVIADGRAIAPRGTPLGDALHGMTPRGPIVCRDAYGRDTGAQRYHWGVKDQSYADPAGAPALGTWADRLRTRGEEVKLTDPGGDPASDRRLQVGRYGTAAGGVLYVRASSYMSELEITAATGCHET